MVQEMVSMQKKFHVFGRYSLSDSVSGKALEEDTWDTAQKSQAVTPAYGRSLEPVVCG